jgi:hypothetical protein
MEIEPEKEEVKEVKEEKEVKEVKEETNENKILLKRKTRKNNAQHLPVGIDPSMLQKYIVYYNEFYDKEKTKRREYFRIEKHPLLKSPWSTSKSNQISIEDKLDQANFLLEKLNKDWEEIQEKQKQKYPNPTENQVK